MRGAKIVKRICMIASEFPPICGGQGVYVYNLSRCLLNRGYAVSVIIRGSLGETYCEVVDGIYVYRVRFLPTYPFHLQPHGFFIKRLLTQLGSNFDIIHFHSHGIPFINTSIPTIVTEHGTAVGFFNSLDSIDLSSFILKMFAHMYISIDKNILKNANKVSAVSDSCAYELKKYYGIENVSVVNNGVDTNLFIPSSRKHNEGYILYVGALMANKGLADLIRCAKYVCKNYPDIRFIIIGNGPLKKYLENLVGTLNLGKNVFFKGYALRDELIKYYQNSKVFVLPSYHEGLPTVLLEAMSCGIPVIATKVPGISEVVIPGKTGLLVPPKDPEILSRAIMSLLNDHRLCENMAKNGRDRAVRFYDWKIIADRFEALYEEVV